MYALDAAQVLVRRWYVLLAGLVLVAAGGLGALVLVPTAYQASGQLLLLLPVSATGAATPTNPYLNAPMGLTTTASLLAGSAITDDAQDALAAAGFASEYSVSVVPGAGPLVVVTSSGTDPADVVATRDAVMERVNRELATIQRDVFVPVPQFMFTAPSSVSRGAEVLPGSRLRALIGVVAAGGILVLALTFGIDRLLQARQVRGPARARGARGARGARDARGARGTRRADEDPAPVVGPVVGPVAVLRGEPVGVQPAGRDGAACVARP